MTEAENDFWALHRRLAKFNRHRLNPRFPTENWRHELATQHENIFLENEILEIERCLIAPAAAMAPCNVKSFLEWFGTLKSNGPGQNSMLFDWLAEFANVEQMRWFIQQEVAGEAGFEDLTAMTQVKIPTRAKLEMARNYWDEMGRGREIGMHGPMLSRVAQEFGLNKIESGCGDDLDSDIDDIVPQVLALGNLMTGMAMNRHYTYHSIGALGAIELTAPLRAKKVYEGLKRLDVSREAQQYYLLHSALDIKHSNDWNSEVLAPLLQDNPHAAMAIAEGALMRLNAGARCFEQYEHHLIGDFQ